MSTRPERGIVIGTAELASEGVEPVLDAVAATGATAITTTTSVMVEAAPETGLREPALDVTGHERVLDRPIWGKRVTHVHYYAPHPPDPALWRDLPWDPPEVAPDEHRTDWARQAIDAARARGLRVHLEFPPYLLPGLPGSRDGALTSAPEQAEFRPKRLVGGPHPEGVAYTGCLNHPAVRALGRARLCEHVRHYGDVDGIALDRVEFPVHFLEKVFTCFCQYCEREATALGYDWSAIVYAARTLWDSLHIIRPELLEALAVSGDWGELVPDAERMQHGMESWLRFKAASVDLAIADLREAMTDEGAGHLELSSAGSPLPWGRMSGAAFPSPDGALDVQRPKLFSFHWLMMVNWWSSTTLSWNQGSSITADAVTRAILALFDMELREPPNSLTPDSFGMPAPDDGHNLTPDSYVNRLESALQTMPGQAPMRPLIHAYHVPQDFAMILDAVEPFARDGVWVQRYGYLSDEKLEILRQAWSGS